MYQTMEALFDGTVLLLDEPITLKADTRVRIQIEVLPEKQQSESWEQLAQEIAEILNGLQKSQREEKPMSGVEALPIGRQITCSAVMAIPNLTQSNLRGNCATIRE